MAGSARRTGRGIATVQAVRAVACLLVVAYHAAGSRGALGRPPVSADAVWPNGAAGVDLFFVVSGFVMAVSSGELKGMSGAARFAGRRWRRVVPLYWLMTFAKLAVLAAQGGAAMPGVWQVLASLLFVPARDAAGMVRPVLGVGWTLQFEMLFYVLFALVLLARARWRLAPLALLLPVLGPLAIAGFFRRPGWPAPCVLANGLVLEFCLGLAVAQIGASMGAPRPRAAWCLLVVASVLLVSLPQPGPWRFLVWGGPAALILFAAVSLEPVVGRRLPNWLLALGEASYAIYLLHPFVVPVLARGLTPAMSLPVLIVASLVASAVGGLALHRWVDRPMQRWLARRGGAALGGSARPVSQLV